MTEEIKLTKTQGQLWSIKQSATKQLLDQAKKSQARAAAVMSSVEQDIKQEIAERLDMKPEELKGWQVKKNGDGFVLAPPKPPKQVKADVEETDEP